MKKSVNHDLAQAVQSLGANRIRLHSNKTEIILFLLKNKKNSKKVNFRIKYQKIEIVKQTKYLSIYPDEHLTWNFQISQIKSKLNRSTTSSLLVKLRYYVKPDILRTFYFAIVDSVLRYGIQAWGQNRNQTILKTIKNIENIHEKTI